MPENVSHGNGGNDRRPIASYWHTLGFVLISIVPVVYGMAMQKAAAGTPAIEPATPERLKFYLISIGSDWLLFYFCWVGVHWKGGDFFQLAGGRWNSAKDALKDIGIALPFWVVWELAARGGHWILGPDQAKPVQPLLPRSFLEVAVWLAVCVTAGNRSASLWCWACSTECWLLGGEICRRTLLRMFGRTRGKGG